MTRSRFREIVNIEALEASITEMKRVSNLEGNKFNMEVYLRDDNSTYEEANQSTLDALKNNCNTSACVVGWCAMSDIKILKPVILDDKEISFPIYERKTFFHECHDNIDPNLHHKVSSAVSALLFNSTWIHYPGCNTIEHYIYRVCLLLDNQDNFVDKVEDMINSNTQPPLHYHARYVLDALLKAQSQNKH